jgi:diguanylate cyclase
MPRVSAQGSARGRGKPANDLFGRIGLFMSAHGLSPEPEHYSFAYAVLAEPTSALAQAVERITEDGVRLSRTDIEKLGGSVRLGPPASLVTSPPASPDGGDQAGRLVDETHAQVEGFANLMRAVHDETRDFGRDLAEHAAEMRRAESKAGIGMSELARIAGDMAQRIRAAEGRLASATRETDELRAKLEEARLAARRDPLTGLPNRRAFEEAFGATPGRRRCIALCDVDRFKAINDGHGHGVGDRVLTAIADTLRVSCDGQLVARHGGEEFAVLIHDLSLERAAELLEDARAGVSAKRFRSRETDALIGRVTISVGLTEVESDEALDLALSRADRFLYTAKSTGRDRLCMG